MFKIMFTLLENGQIKQNVTTYIGYVGYGGQPFVLVPNLYDEKSPPDIWDVVVRLEVSVFTVRIG